jgi:hypothetical protein
MKLSHLFFHLSGMTKEFPTLAQLCAALLFFPRRKAGGTTCHFEIKQDTISAFDFQLLLKIVWANAFISY